MFRNRNNSQKPNDELLAAFKQNFPGVGHNATSSKEETVPGQMAVTTSTADASLLHHSSRQDSTYDLLFDAPINTYGSEHHRHDDAAAAADDITPSRFAMEPWRLTPSIFDPNAFSMAHMGNTPMGYYTPTSGGANTVYHNQAAGDLHTPSLAFQLGTPLSVSIPDGSLHSGASFDPTFNSHLFATHGFDSSHLFPQQSQHHQHQQQRHHQAPEQQQQHLMPPSLLVHKDSGIGGSENSPVPGMMPSGQQQQHLLGNQPDAYDQKAALWFDNSSLEQFRYHVTLNAPTAMVRSKDEVPITYLNKGQAYTLSIFDSLPVAPPPRRVRYRTTIRISFEDEEQRAKPGQCWQLWKEGRGLAESHQRGGKLQAVEYVDPHPGAAEDDPRKPRIIVERESFDGFSVSWSPAAHATSPNAECAIAVRFNFLSTDFSHSKGVKGIPVRLCAKTHMLGDNELDNDDEEDSNIHESEEKILEQPADAEVAYCKVKLFRDHGAERKLTNDIAHVKKSIDKLKNQIQQLESGIKEPGRRKRTSMSLGKLDAERPAKLAKHKRAWSVSSTGSGGGNSGVVGGGKGSVEEDLSEKLSALQEMFGSPRPISVLFLRGEDEDDMEKYPVSLPGEGEHVQQPAAVRTNSWEQRTSNDRSRSGSSASSTKAMNSATAKGFGEADSAMFAVPAVPTKVRGVRGSFDAVGVHSGYMPPTNTIEKAVACVFLRRKEADNYYKAVYLWSRSCAELLLRACQKFGMDPERVHQIVRVTSSGLEVELDDESVEQLEEGQDMEFSIDGSVSGIKIEDLAHLDAPGSTDGAVLKLFY